MYMGFRLAVIICREELYDVNIVTCGVKIIVVNDWKMAGRYKSKLPVGLP